MEAYCGEKRKLIDEDTSRLKKAKQQEALDAYFLFKTGDGDLGECRSHWTSLSPEVKKDTEVVTAAIGCGAVNVLDLPLNFQERDFLLRAVRVNSKVWIRLPMRFKSNVEFARAIQDYSVIDNLAQSVFLCCPSLLSDPGIWTTIINSNGCCRFSNHLVPPQEILSDRDLMAKACLLQPVQLGYVNAELLEDQEFVATVLETFPRALRHLPHGAQTRFPDLVATAFLNGGAVGFIRIYAPALIFNRRVVKAWFQGGGRFSRLCPGEWMKDKEICLWIAGQSKTSKCNVSSDEVRQRSLASFAFASERLRNNKDFMLQAMELQPCVFQCAGPNIKRDFDLALMAFGNSRACATAFYSGGCRADRTFAEHVLHRVSERLTVQRTFIHAVAYNISRRGGRLAALNQGNESANEFKLRLAELLGVPRGKKLLLYRCALENLLTAIHAAAV